MSVHEQIQMGEQEKSELPSHSFSADEGTIQLCFHAVHKKYWCDMVDLREAKAKENQHIVICRGTEKSSFLQNIPPPRPTFDRGTSLTATTNFLQSQGFNITSNSHS